MEPPLTKRILWTIARLGEAQTKLADARRELKPPAQPDPPAMPESVQEVCDHALTTISKMYDDISHLIKALNDATIPPPCACVASVTTPDGSVRTYDLPNNNARFAVFGQAGMMREASVVQWCATEPDAEQVLPEWQQHGGHWTILPVTYTNQST